MLNTFFPCSYTRPGGRGIWNDRAAAVEKCNEMNRQNNSVCVRPRNVADASTGIPRSDFFKMVAKYPFIGKYV